MRVYIPSYSEAQLHKQWYSGVYSTTDRQDKGTSWMLVRCRLSLIKKKQEASFPQRLFCIASLSNLLCVEWKTTLQLAQQQIAGAVTRTLGEPVRAETILQQQHPPPPIITTTMGVQRRHLPLSWEV